MRKALPALALPALVAVLALAGCGGSSGPSYGSSSGNESTGAGKEGSGSEAGYGSKGAGYGEGSSGGAAGAATVSTGSAAKVGQVLVDSQGMTLYYFEKDKGMHGKSACSGACAGGWPPLTTSGAAKAMGSAMAAKLGTSKRSDGTTQVTYAGWPLYTYVGDHKPGEANGTDLKAFGGSWYPLHPNGKQAGS